MALHPPRPVAPTAARPTAWARSIGSGVLFVAVAVVVQLVRQPGLSSWNTIWAEDGLIFTGDALTLPAVQTLMRDYAGYAQFTTRVLALGTRAVPPSGYATYLAASAAVVVALLGLVVVRSARSWVRSPVLRWSLGVMVVVAPVTFSELTAAITNVGWPFLIAGFWAIASREEGRFDTPVRALTVLIGAVSTVIQVVLLPWAVIMAIHRRRRSDVIVLASLVVGLGIQGIADLAARPQHSDSTRSVGELAELLGLRVFGSLVTGERWISHLSTTAAIGIGVVSLTAVVVMVILARPGRLDLDRRILVVVAALTAIGSYVVTVWYRGTSSVDLWVPEGYVLSGGRYGYLPVLLLFSALVVMVDSSGRDWLQVVLLAQTAFVIATSLTLATARSSGPAWAESVRSAQAQCRADPGLDQVHLPISPAPMWMMPVDCDRLR
ncbi:MAG: hypothetical protein ACXWBN_10875 [Acidimicrobiales bacterium]